eukprot:98000-Chlamydomonas_euryale.AAC.1
MRPTHRYAPTAQVRGHCTGTRPLRPHAWLAQLVALGKNEALPRLSLQAILCNPPTPTHAGEDRCALPCGIATATHPAATPVPAAAPARLHPATVGSRVARPCPRTCPGRARRRRCRPSACTRARAPRR